MHNLSLILASLEMSTIKVAIAEDHHLMRTGLSKIISSFKNMELQVIVGSGNELFRQNLSSMDLILVDLDMPFLKGFETVKQLNYSEESNYKIIGLTNDMVNQDVFHAFEIGAKAVLPKDLNEKELEKALNSVVEEGYFLSDSLASLLIKGLEQRYRQKPTGYKGLYSEQERFILIRLCQGKKASEIAAELNRSVRTIENIKAGMMEKAEVQKTVSLVVHAIKHGIIELSDLD